MRYLLGLLVTLLAGPVLACTVAPSSVTEFPESIVWVGNAEAFYDKGTDRYPHGVLGDDIEPTILHFDGEELSLQAGFICGTNIKLPDDLVFEDLAPRLVDLDADGYPEIVTIRSHQGLGAQVAVYDVIDGKLQVVAETPFIGVRFRWLAIAGVADLNEDGLIEIAYVDRPHLAKTLRVWQYLPDGGLRELASLDGLSNHKIGEDFITGGVRDCEGDMALVLPNANRTELVEVVLQFERLYSRVAGPFSQDLMEELLACG